MLYHLTTTTMDDALRSRLEATIHQKPVVLFMKGTKNFPQCGFSGTVVQILNALGTDYDTVNVLADPAVRDGIKEYSNWPTIPQLYVNGELVGGCDIVRAMHAKGELEPLLRGAGAVPSKS